MRFLLVQPGPDFSVADVYHGWERALRALGHTVKGYNTNERLSFYGTAHSPNYNDLDDNGNPRFVRSMTDEEAMTAAMQGLSHELYTFSPQVVVFVSAFYVAATTLQVIRAHGHKVVIIHTESPYQDDEQLIRAQHANLNLLNDPTNLEDYRALCKNSYYMPHAYDPAIHFPGDGSYASDFSFIGTMYKSRRDFFEPMITRLHSDDVRYRITLGGAGWDNDYMADSHLLRFLGHPVAECVDNAETANLYRASRAGINFYRRESEGEHAGEGWAMGPREIEMAACGMPFIRDPRPESDELFPFLPSFASPAEAADQLRWLLADEARRVSLASRARSAIRNRTFDNNARQMLTYLERA